MRKSEKPNQQKNPKRAIQENIQMKKWFGKKWDFQQMRGNRDDSRGHNQCKIARQQSRDAAFEVYFCIKKQVGHEEVKIQKY